MKNHDKDPNTVKPAKPGQMLARTLVAAYYDVDAVEALAKQEGIPFNREDALMMVEATLGEEEAKRVQNHWSKEGQQAREARYRKAIDRAMQSAPTETSWDRLVTLVRRPAEEIAAALNAALDALRTPNLSFRTAGRRGETPNGPVVEPLIDYEEGILYVTLEFAPQVKNIPSDQSAIKLFIEDEEIKVFDFTVSASGGNKIILRVRVDARYAERHSQMGCEIKGDTNNLNRLIVQVYRI